MKTLRIIPLLILLITSCSKDEFYTSEYNPKTYWENSFGCSGAQSCIDSQTINDFYDRLLPVGNKWTYATIQPDGANLDISTDNYLKCYTPERTDNLTSKAQIVRKFPPYEILEGYEGITAFNATDIVTVSMKLNLNSEYLNDSKIYFLDFEDSMTQSAGIRFFIYNNTAIGVNIDKIKETDNTFYSETSIPIDEWFSFRLEMLISDQGYYKIWINGNLVFDINEQSFHNNLNFYDAVMVGITGTIKDTPSEIWVDDFSLNVERGNY